MASRSLVVVEFGRAAALIVGDEQLGCGCDRRKQGWAELRLKIGKDPKECTGLLMSRAL